MRHFYNFIAIWLALASFLVAEDANPIWEKIHSEAGIDIYSRSKPGTNFYKYRGVGIIKARPSKIFTVIQDARLITEWVSGTKNIRLLKKNYSANSFGRNPQGFVQIIYGESVAPWPFQNRDYVLKGKVDMSLARGAASIKLNDIKYKTYPPRDGLTRMRYMNIEFILTPRNNRRYCLLDFTLDVHPGGVIPFFVVNHLAKKETIRTLKNLRKLSQRKQYDKNMEKLINHYWK